MVEKFFWADAIANQIIKRKNKKEYVCASGISPSGTVHIGNFREIITTDLVVKALKEKGKKVRFIYSWDDFDRFRKVPKNIPEKRKAEYENYIGMPISDVPSPFEKGNYAEHFEKEFEDSLIKVGINPEFIQQNIMNKKCKYAELIKVALDKREIIIRILNRYREEPLKENWFPVEVYCERCKKDSTEIIEAEKYEIKYKCECGFEEKFDYRKKGIVKLKWRVDWPARWFYEKVDFEPGGIDHSVYGGSFMTGKEIAKKIFDYEPPLYQFYEWVRPKGGTEFSSSSGNALSLNDVEEIYEPEILRYIFVGTRPNKGFAISFDADVIKIYEDYDKLEEEYFEGRLDDQQKRIYELSQINTSKKRKIKIGFRHLITLVQIGKTNDLNEASKKRAEKVKKWIEKYAPDDFKFEVQKKLKFPFEGTDKDALIELREVLKSKEFTEEELFNEFYNICQKLEIKNTDFFKTCYQAIIGKEKGPRLASLILAIEKDKVIKLLGALK
jgi:lysyl-tRNA synthetase class 1